MSEAGIFVVCIIMYSGPLVTVYWLLAIMV